MTDHRANDQQTTEPEPETKPSRYELRIFDGPATEGGTEWEPMTLKADHDDTAIQRAQRRLESACACLCNVADGYSVGDEISAHLFNARGTIVATLSHLLTADDLGVED